jgi:hypothetical protein
MIAEVACVCLTAIICWAMWLRDSHEARLEATEAAQLRAEMEALGSRVDDAVSATEAATEVTEALEAEVGAQIRKLLEHEQKIMGLQMRAPMGARPG